MMLVKGHKVAVMNDSRDLMCSIMTVVDNTVLNKLVFLKSAPLVT